MRAETRLDSAVFQLTPTRTRCDLVILADGKMEKLASGLVNPFISHLKIAQDQIARGGYSIKLEPENAVEAVWFTKGTMDRFVRFVSTPDILERVNSIELEILQIEKAISIQGNESFGLSSVDEHHQTKSNANIEGRKQISDEDSEKAIILYKPGLHSNLPESNESKVHEENSKVQLLRVLESRKKVLQKEQTMAFACTAAAGFDIESMSHLKLFAESFGASRLLEACSHYMYLWKRKYESGQLAEIEAVEAMSYRPEYLQVNSPDIVLSGDTVRQREAVEWSQLYSSIDAKTGSNGNTISQDIEKEKKVASEPFKYYHEQLQHSFPQWPMIHPHSMQPMPYYQNYSANGQFFYPPPAQMDDPLQHTVKKKPKRRLSTKNDHYSESEDELSETALESEEESSKSYSHHGKPSRSRKNKGVVVIRNLNYIAGKRSEVPGNKSESTNDSEVDEKKEPKSSKIRDFDLKTSEVSNGHENGEDNWQTFQNFLLTAEEKMISVSEKGGHDHILLSERDFSSCQKESITDYNPIIEERSRTACTISADELIANTAQFIEVENGARNYQQTSSDALVDFEHELVNNSKKGSLHDLKDDSFMIPLRSSSQDMCTAESRLAIDVESEFRRNEDFSCKTPDDLALLIGRARESESIGYNMAINCDIQVISVSKHESKKEEETLVKSNEGSSKIGGEKKNKNSLQNGSEKRRKDTPMTAKFPSSKSASLTEAQKRAEKLRSYKADLQRMKKDQEAEVTKRLEALKSERQKRIASRSGSLKVSPTTLKTSKFMNAEPGSNSPLPKLSIKANNASKAPTSNRLSRSASLLLDVKKDGAKKAESVASERIRRLSEPKAGSTHIKTKSANSSQVNKKPLLEPPQSKKISAIIQLDKTKSETLPELKIKTCNVPPPADLAMSESRHCDSKVEEKGFFSYNDENPLIEKTMVMLKNEAVFASPVFVNQGEIHLVDMSSRDAKHRTDLSADCTEISTTPNLEVKSKDMNEGGNFEGDQLHSYESQASSAIIDTIVSDASSIDQMDEFHEKLRDKELKGFKKLWKFGRKGSLSSLGDASLDSNGPFSDDHLATNSSSSSASTLKSLISQDETNFIGGSSAKVSRPFSILSPFRGKKVAA